MDESQEYRYGVPVKLVSWFEKRREPDFVIDDHLIFGSEDFQRALDIYIPKAGYIQYKIGQYIENKYWDFMRWLWKRGAFPTLEVGESLSFWRHFNLKALIRR